MGHSHTSLSHAKQLATGLSYRILSLGCKCNRYESDALALYFRSQGLREAESEEKAQILVLNTCTVTAEAGRKSRQQLRRLRRINKEAVLAVMGCHSQLEDLSAWADLCTGTAERMPLARAALALAQKRRGEAYQQDELPLGKIIGETRPAPVALQTLPKRQTTRSFEDLGPVMEQHETRAQIKIQDGCDHACSYCTIPLARGRVRSRPRAAILEEARRLVENGVHELVLTGIHISSFEKDLGRDAMALAELLQELEALPGNFQIRLGSLEPGAMSEAFVDAIAPLQRLCPHFHLSLQSGSDPVLLRMRRHYDLAQYARSVAALRAVWPSAGLTTDVICGFPEESAKEHQESLAFVEAMGLSRVHVFRYSRREKTLAARMRPVPPELMKERAQEMQALADRLAQDFAAKEAGRPAPFLVLTEEKKGEAYTGYTRNYLPVRLDAGAASLGPGQLWEAEALGASEGSLELRALRPAFIQRLSK